MSKKTKIITVSLCSLLVIAGILSIFFFVRQSKKNPSIFFYGISQKDVQALKNQIQTFSQEKEITFDFLELDHSTPLEKQISFVNRPSLVFVHSGTDLENAIKEAGTSMDAGLSLDLLSPMTTSCKNTAVIQSQEDQHKVKALPLYTDHLEISIDKVQASIYGKNINTWEDIESFALNRQSVFEHPVVFAGKDPETLIDILGAITESFYGEKEYQKAVDLIKIQEDEKFNARRIAKRLTQDSEAPLTKSVSVLRNWYHKGLIHPNIFQLEKKDVKAYVKAKLVCMVLMSFSDHRDFDPTVMRRFTSIYFPSQIPGIHRRFTGPVTYAVPFEASQEIQDLCSRLVNDRTQELLSRETGMAPVLSRCRVPDKQAYQVRYWIAGSGKPLPGLSKDNNLDHNQLSQVAQELISMITQ